MTVTAIRPGVQRTLSDHPYLADWPEEEWTDLDDLAASVVASWDGTSAAVAQQAIIEARHRWGGTCPKALLRGLAVEVSLRGTPEGATLLLDVLHRQLSVAW